MIGRLVFTMALLAAPAATAQDPASARGQAEELIAATGAPGLFENLTSGQVPTVRHRPSGMICEFAGDGRDVLRLFDVQPGGPVRGDDVGCGHWIGTTYVTLFATRYPHRPSAQEILDSAVDAIMRSWPDARAYAGSAKPPRLRGQAEPLMRVFEVILNGQPARSLVLVSHLGDWSFKARASGPANDDSVVEASGTAFARALPDAATAGGD